ncbi:MAG TPA: HepT-like ribonuclease domain-containing protein [Acidimicrobiales bacterium]|nr:HepT-like ribonuclease domain-containing protein [Acidimicrobiales bacterium]
MTRADEHRIADILEAADKLAVRLPDSFEAWLDDEDLRLVTERLVEIIGEAARAMTTMGREKHPEIDWAGLVGLRNVLVHAYHRIQPDLLWQAATVEVPRVVAHLRGRRE